MTPATLRIAIGKLMSDGRERTLNDVRLGLKSRLKVEAPDEMILRELNTLCRRKRLSSRGWTDGDGYVGTFRARVKQEAGQ